MSTAAPSRVKLEHEAHIAVPKQQIMAALLERLDKADEARLFGDFCRLIEGIYHFEYHRTANELKDDFRLFDSSSGVFQRARSSEEQLLAAEERFLENFRRLMEKGNFRPLSQHDVDVAEAEDYLFNLPVQTDWRKLDSGMLRRFYEQHGYGRDIDPPHFAERILIFRRGVGIDQTVGFLFLQKIDVIVSKLLVGLWGIVTGTIKAVGWLLGRRKATDRGQHGLEADVDAALGDDETYAPAAAEDSAGSCRFAERYVERITLAHHGVGPLSLFRRTPIQEPTFAELVILFRFATPIAANVAAEKDWDIHIKAFRDIPMADLEVVFPEKHISMKPLDLVKLLLTAAIGVGVACTKLLVAALNPILAAAALTTMAGYASRIFFGFKASKDRYNHLVTNSLYHKSLDNNLGVIFYLMDSLEEQEFKEAVLGYYVLWREGDMTAPDLDARCESLLHECFGIETNFEIADALAKLQRDDLIVRDGDVLRARPVAEALERLDHKWDAFFRYHEGNAH